MVRQFFAGLFARQMKSQAEGKGRRTFVQRAMRIPRVREATTPEERQRVFQFRYRIYVADMGKNPAHANHVTREITDALDDHAIILYIEDEGEITATLRCNFGLPPQGSPVLEEQFAVPEITQQYSHERLAFTSCTMTSPEVRKSLHMAAMFSYLYCLGRQQRIVMDLILCAPGLVQFFISLGYRRYKDNVVLPDVGLRVPMMLLLEHDEYLAEVRSPLYPLAQLYPSCEASYQWFCEHYADSVQHSSICQLPPRTFWQHIDQRMCGYEVDLFAGFSEEEIHHTLTAKTVIPCGRDTHIVRAGDVGREMFVVVSGVVEVFLPQREGPRSLAVLGPGETFGEMAFLSQDKRSVDVVALTDVELIVISQNYLKRLQASNPLLASKLLLNIALMLCERVRCNGSAADDYVL